MRFRGTSGFPPARGGNERDGASGGCSEAGGGLGLTCSRSSTPRGVRGAARFAPGLRPGVCNVLWLSPPQALWSLA